MRVNTFGWSHIFHAAFNAPAEELNGADLIRNRAESLPLKVIEWIGEERVWGSFTAPRGRGRGGRRFMRGTSRYFFQNFSFQPALLQGNGN